MHCFLWFITVIMENGVIQLLFLRQGLTVSDDNRLDKDLFNCFSYRQQLANINFVNASCFINIVINMLKI